VFQRYLEILGVESEPPSLGHLKRLTAAQLQRVPFENISKLYLRKTKSATTVPTLEEHLDGIAQYNFGGTCYANNPYFFQLLQHLGYEVTLSGADMSNPDVHIVTMVALGGRQYLVDAGYGAPFYEPLPRDLDHPFEIVFGACRFVLEPQDEEGRSRLKMYREGKLTHGYLAKPWPRQIGDFEDIVRDSYRETATFMNAVVVERFLPGRSVRIHNLSMTESTPSSSKVTPLADGDELVRMVEREFGISSAVVREAIEGIALEADIYT
jgi:arylamine N-acetyltransferase